LVDGSRADLHRTEGADAFLGTQSDPWDTQSDMLLALIGAIMAMVLLSRLQDSQMNSLWRWWISQNQLHRT